MLDSTSLSLDERTVLRLCVHRMALGTFGSLATLPLFCFRELRISDVRSVIDERYDIWRSHLVVVRQLLELKPALLNKATPSLEALFSVAVRLRDSFVKLSQYDELPPDQVIAAHAALVSAFENIAPNVSILGKAVEVDLAPITTTIELRRGYYNNTLNWIGSEIRQKLVIPVSPRELSPAV